MSTLELEQHGTDLWDLEVRDRSDPERWEGVEVRGYVEPDLEILPRSKGGDGRTVYGIVVPYGKRQRIHDGLEEMFRAGAATHQLRQPARMKFSREHIKLGGALIGRATELRDDTAGLVGYLRASKTELGDETLTLVEDGALDELSVGFQAVRSKVHPDGLVERVRVNILETAVVLQGAYGRNARVQGIRSADGAAAEQQRQEGMHEAPSGPESGQQPDAGTDAPEGMDLALARAQATQTRSRILIYSGLIR